MLLLPWMGTIQTHPAIQMGRTERSAWLTHGTSVGCGCCGGRGEDLRWQSRGASREPVHGRKWPRGTQSVNAAVALLN